MLSTTTVSKDTTPQNIEYIKSFKDIQVNTWFRMVDYDVAIYFKLNATHCFRVANNSIQLRNTNDIFPDNYIINLEMIAKVDIKWR